MNIKFLLNVKIEYKRVWWGTKWMQFFLRFNHVKQQGCQLKPNKNKGGLAHFSGIKYILIPSQTLQAKLCVLSQLKKTNNKK